MSIMFTITIKHLDGTSRVIHEPEVWDYMNEVRPDEWTCDGEGYQQTTGIAVEGYEMAWRFPTEQTAYWTAEKVGEEMRKRKANHGHN